MFTSAALVCRMTRILPATLKCWQSASLITPPSQEGYSESQVAQIRVISILSSSGDTLSEISTLLNDSWQYRHSGWECRRQEFILQLVSGTDETRAHYLWQLYTSYRPEDVVTYLLMPVAEWLRQEDKNILRARYLQCLTDHTQRLLKTRQCAENIKPLLKVIKQIKRYRAIYLCHQPSVNRNAFAPVNVHSQTSLAH